MKVVSYKFLHLARRVCNLGFKLLRRLEGFCCRRMQDFPEQLAAQHLHQVLQVTKAHNMATLPDEAYYGRQYWHWLREALEEFFERGEGREPLPILDLGCGQGRLTLPLAHWGRSRGVLVTGVDISATALDSARKSAQQGDLGEVIDFVQDDLLGFLQAQPAASFSAVACMEVLYMLPESAGAVVEIARVLAPNGLLLASFRPRYYQILQAIQAHRWPALPILLNSTEGYPIGPPIRFSWYNIRELSSLLAASGFKVHTLKGIGVVSGIEGDPLAAMARPSMLSPEEQQELLAVELALAEEMANCGRYILAIATKRESDDQLSSEGGS